MIQPQPLPENWEIQTATDQTGKPWVVLKIHSPNGLHISFIEPEAAKTIGGLLLGEVDNATKPKLFLPPNGFTMP